MTGIFEKRVEELILISIILLNLIDLFNLLSAELSYVKFIINWFVLGYLLFKISISDILLGNRHKQIDIILIASYFLLIIKNLTALSNEIIHKSGFLYSFFLLLVENAQQIEIISFYIGIGLIIFVSFYITYFIDISEPSILHVLHGPGKQSKITLNNILKNLTIFITLIGFFIIVFNLIMDWFVVVLEAPIMIIAILFYLFKFHSYSKNLRSESSLFKITDFSENIYKRFINLFHKKETFFLGISGMLVLHLITDVANFIIPYTLGLNKTLYIENIGVKRTTIFYLVLNDIKTLNLFYNKLFVVMGYFFNIIAILFLMIFPAYIWYVLYTPKKVSNIPNFLIALFYSSLFFYLFIPVFKITQLESKNLLGVDIKIQSLLATNHNFIAIGIFAIILLLFSFLQCKYSIRMKQVFIIVMTIINIIFFGMYIYNYFINLANFYLSSIINLFNNSFIFLSFFMGLFLLITSGFYIVGYIVFVYSVFKN
jgi:hypothetical protein